jgi:hypothetical protein
MMPAALAAMLLAASPPQLSPPPLLEAPASLPGVTSGLSAPPLLEAVFPDAASLPWFGVSADVGVPDGVGISLALRPVSWLRVSGGPVHNSAATGLRAELTLIPLQWPVRPTLSAALGRYGEGDARPLARAIVGAAFLGEDAFERVEYDWASVMVGLELGSARSFSLALQGGLSRARLWLPSVEGSAQAGAGEVNLTTSVPHLELWAPSVRVGLIVYLY